MHPNQLPQIDPTRVSLNRAQRRAINNRPGAVFVAVPPGSGFETGDRFKVPGYHTNQRGQWSRCLPGRETELTAVVCHTPGAPPAPKPRHLLDLAPLPNTPDVLSLAELARP